MVPMRGTSAPMEKETVRLSRCSEHLARTWPRLRWQLASGPQPHEAALLQLDSAKAKMHLGWRPVWDLEKAIHHTANWYRQLLEVGEVSSAEELAAYVADAVNSRLVWATA